MIDEPTSAGARPRVPSTRIRRRRTICPGQKLTVSAARRASSDRAEPVARHVQRHRSADAEMRPQERARQPRRGLIVDPQRQFGVVRDAAEDRDGWLCRSSVSRSGTSPGVVGTIVWPSRHAIAKPEPSLPLFGSERPPMASTTRDASMSPRVVAIRYPSLGWRDVDDPMIGGEGDADAAGFVHERVENVARPVAVGKQLAVCLFVQRHAESRERTRRCRRTGQPRSTRRTIVRRPPQKSASVTFALVTLQRAPPLTRILAPRPLRAVDEDDG